MANQYLRVAGAIGTDIYDSNTLEFNPSEQTATAFSLAKSPFSGNGRLHSTLRPDRSVTYFSGRDNSPVFVPLLDTHESQTVASCRLDGATTDGNTGSFSCPNGVMFGAAESLTAIRGGSFSFRRPGDPDTEVDTIEPEYIIFTGDPAATAAPTTAVVVASTPERTPSFLLSVASGPMNGQVLHARNPVQLANGRTIDGRIEFPAVDPNTAATPFVTRPADGALVPASLAADPADYAVYYCTNSYRPDSAGVVISTTQNAAGNNAQLASCQLVGPSDIASSGSFSCSNGGAELHNTAYVYGTLNFTTNATPSYAQAVTLQYTYVS